MRGCQRHHLHAVQGGDSVVLDEVAGELHVAGGQGEQREEEVEDVDPVEQVQLGRPGHCAVLLMPLRTVLDSEGQVGDQELEVEVDEEERGVFELRAVLEGDHQDHGEDEHKEDHRIHQAQQSTHAL